MAARTGKGGKKKEEPQNPYLNEVSDAGKAALEHVIEHVQAAQNDYDGSADGFFKLGQLIIDIQIRLRRIEEHLEIEIDPPEHEQH